MEEIFDLYGDMLLAVVVAAAFFVFLLSLIADGGILNQTIQMHGNTICMKLCGIREGYI